MSNRPLVSVVTSFLDEERYLCQAVESVLAQGYERWELLLVDDGSRDGSSEAARRYAAAYRDRIRYLHHPGYANRGAGESRNLGVRSARGEFIAFLDADDLWLPFKLERQVPLLIERPEAGLLYGNTLFWHSTTHEPRRTAPDYVQRLGVAPGTLVPPPALLILLLRDEDTHPTTGSLLVRRSLFDEVGGFEAPFPGLYEDTAFLAKAYLRRPVLVTGECSATCRLHSESTCYQAWTAGLLDWNAPNPARGAFLRWLERHLHGQGVTDAGLWRALRSELLPYDHPRAAGVRKALRAPMRVARRTLRALRR